jgi:hypothetical protein
MRRFLQSALVSCGLAGFLAAPSAGYDLLRTVALQGTPAPGTTSNFSGFATPVINNRGQTAFHNDAAGGGIWSEEAGKLSLVTQTDRQAQLLGLGINDQGHIAFHTNLSQLSIVTASQSDSTLIAEVGAVPAGTNSGEDYDSFGYAALNNSGQVAFAADFCCDTFSEAIFAGPAANVQVLAEYNTQAPEANANFDRVGDPVLNNAGDVAFWASLTGGDANSSNWYGIWSNGSGELAEVVRAGETAPGIAATFDEFSDPDINAAGHIAFWGLADNGDTATAGIWSDSSGSLELIARSGSLAPTPVPQSDFDGFRALY